MLRFQILVLPEFIILIGLLGTGRKCCRRASRVLGKVHTQPSANRLLTFQSLA